MCVSYLASSWEVILTLFPVSDCTDYAFRVMINLTDASSLWSKAVASNPYSISTIICVAMSSQATVTSRFEKKTLLDEDQEEATKAMDRLCLALALLTNLLQEFDTLGVSMQDISELHFALMAIALIASRNRLQCFVSPQSGLFTRLSMW